MGVGSSTLDFVRKIFRKSQYHQVPYVPASGSSLYTGQGTNFDFMSSNASLMGIADYIRIEQDLISRYVDYEDQDSSPLIASSLDIYCITGDVKIPLLNGETKSVLDLYESKAKDFYVYSFDMNAKKVIQAKCEGVKKTGENQSILKVLFLDGSFIRCTADHQFLTSDFNFVEAKDLNISHHLLLGFNLRDQSSFFKGIQSIQDDGIEDVYDLMNVGEFHNFAAGTQDSHVFISNSDDSTQTDSFQRATVWIESEDEQIRNDLNHLLNHTINIEETIWSLARTLVKYGNCYSELVVRDQVGVLAMNHIPSPTMRRIEIPAEIGKSINRQAIGAETVGFLYDPQGAFKITTREFINELNHKMNNTFNPDGTDTQCRVFENWEIIHMRLLGKNPDSIYGWGIGEPARWIYKRLCLLEDSIVLHRLSRAPSRFAFYIDVSGMPPSDVPGYLNKVSQQMKRQKFINPQNGQLDLRYSPLSSDQDFFLPTREGKESTRIDTLQGPIYDAIEDIKYFSNQLFAALKIPKPFLTYEESTAKTNLSAEDSRFARTVLRIQREIKNGIYKLCEVHLAAKGIDPQAVQFTVEMTMPSAIFELAQLEIRSAELELADKFQAYAPTSWIMSNILGFSEEQIEEMRLMKIREEQAGNEPHPSSGGSSVLDRHRDDFTPGSSAGEEAAPPQESIFSKRKFYGGKKHNVSNLHERIDELRDKNKRFNQYLDQLKNDMDGIKSYLKK